MIIDRHEESKSGFADEMIIIRSYLGAVLMGEVVLQQLIGS